MSRGMIIITEAIEFCMVREKNSVVSMVMLCTSPYTMDIV